MAPLPSVGWTQHHQQPSVAKQVRAHRPGTAAEGGFSLSAGLGADYRLVNLFFVGLTVRYTEAFGDGIYRRSLSIPLQFSFYW